LVGEAFGIGFSQAIYSPGLVIVAAGFVAGLAESTAGSAWLLARIDRSGWFGSSSIAVFLGLIAGIGALPAAAFALVTPLLRAIGGGTAQNREATTIAPALAI
jgi:hypothetical protein